MLAHEGTDALPALDVSLLGQVRQRAPHRDAGHPELVAQRLLGGQRVAGGEDAAVDLVVQHQEELPVQRHPGGVDTVRLSTGLDSMLPHHLSCAVGSLVICI